MRVFFYGLFMDERVLAKKGIIPADTRTGFIDGYKLQIGERATLVARPAGRVYGVMMEISADDATQLYAEPSVADYRPELVQVELMDGTKVQAIVYNLPAASITGTNKDYAESLLKLACELGFPKAYVDQIRQARG